MRPRRSPTPRPPTSPHPYDPNAQPVGTGGFQQHPFTPGPVSGTGRAKRSPVVMLAVAGVALIAVIGIAVLAMQAFNKDGGGGGGGGGDKPTPPTPTVALAQADLEDKMTSWVSGLGFVSPTVTCQGDLGRDEGSVQFCDIDADGTPSWGQAEVTGYDGDEPTVEMLPYLPGDTVAQAIEDSNTSGETISVDCTDYLLGVVGEEIDCPVTGSSAGSTVQISVTKIEELRINFNWQVV